MPNNICYMSKRARSRGQRDPYDVLVIQFNDDAYELIGNELGIQANDDKFWLSATLTIGSEDKLALRLQYEPEPIVGQRRSFASWHDTHNIWEVEFTSQTYPWILNIKPFKKIEVDLQINDFGQVFITVPGGKINKGKKEVVNTSNKPISIEEQLEKLTFEMSKLAIVVSGLDDKYERKKA